MTQSNEPSIEQMDIIIADFMGYNYMASKFYSKERGNTYAWFKDAKYHTSWDWLMPVVEKIHALAVAGDAINAITSEEIFAFSIFAPLKDVHKAVYQFITWHNDNQQKQINDNTGTNKGGGESGCR